MSTSGKIQITFMPDYVRLLGVDAIVAFSWHGTEGDVTVNEPGSKRHIRLKLKSEDQKIVAECVGYDIYNNPLAAMAVAAVNKRSELEISRLEDDKQYIRPKFDISDFAKKLY